MRRSLAWLAPLLAVTLVPPARAARADLQAFYSASLGVGHAHRNHADDGFAWNLRPEMILTADVDAPVLGIGPYLQLELIHAPAPGHAGPEALLGGGVTAVLYHRSDLAVAGSIGLEAGDLGAGWHHQLALSLFAGFRTSDLGALDMPFGFRIEGRPGTDALPATAVASFSVDLIAIGVGVQGLRQLLSRH